MNYKINLKLVLLLEYFKEVSSKDFEILNYVYYNVLKEEKFFSKLVDEAFEIEIEPKLRKKDRFEYRKGFEERIFNYLKNKFKDFKINYFVDSLEVKKNFNFPNFEKFLKILLKKLGLKKSIDDIIDEIKVRYDKTQFLRIFWRDFNLFQYFSNEVPLKGYIYPLNEKEGIINVKIENIEDFLELKYNKECAKKLISEYLKNLVFQKEEFLKDFLKVMSMRNHYLYHKYPNLNSQEIIFFLKKDYFPEIVERKGKVCIEFSENNLKLLEELLIKIKKLSQNLNNIDFVLKLTINDEYIMKNLKYLLNFLNFDY